MRQVQAELPETQSARPDQGGRNVPMWRGLPLEARRHFRALPACCCQGSVAVRLPGDIVQEKLEHAIVEAGCVAVCIGPNGLGRWQTVEYQSVYQRLIEDSEPDDELSGFRSGGRVRVIPVLLPGAKLRQIPAFLKQHLYADLRQTSADKQAEALRKLATGILAVTDK